MAAAAHQWQLESSMGRRREKVVPGRFFLNLVVFCCFAVSLTQAELEGSHLDAIGVLFDSQIRWITPFLV